MNDVGLLEIHDYYGCIVEINDYWIPDFRGRLLLMLD